MISVMKKNIKGEVKEIEINGCAIRVVREGLSEEVIFEQGYH